MTQPNANPGWATRRRRYEVDCAEENNCAQLHMRTGTWLHVLHLLPDRGQMCQVWKLTVAVHCTFPLFLVAVLVEHSPLNSKRLVRCLLDHSWLSSTLPRGCRSWERHPLSLAGRNSASSVTLPRVIAMPGSGVRVFCHDFTKNPTLTRFW